MDSPDTKIVRTTTWSAGPGCHGGCGVLAHVKDGKLVKIEGDPEHPWNQGRLCARALAMTQYVENPARLRKPLMRVGERGEGKWQEISWDEAYDLIEKRMGAIRDQYGPEAMVFSMGTGRDIGPWICMLAYAYGSPNVMFALSGNACYSPRIAALDTVQGDYCVFDAGQWLPDRYEDPQFKAARGDDHLGLQHPGHLPGQSVWPLDHRHDEKGHQDHLHRPQAVLVRIPQPSTGFRCAREPTRPWPWACCG
jgi:anaerobic selenocysteine-containing dehydrogenase